MINCRQADLSDKPTFFISNRLVWQAAGITRVRHHRWPVACPDRTGQERYLQFDQGVPYLVGYFLPT